MPTITVKGKAIIEAIVGGVPTNIAVWAAILPQSQDATQNWDEEIIKDGQGYDASWLARNLNKVRSMTIKPTAASKAAAKLATVFLSPFAKITFSGSDSTEFDGDWQYLSGAKIELKNDSSATLTFSCKKYDDSTQNTASTTAAS